MLNINFNYFKETFIGLLGYSPILDWNERINLQVYAQI
jgi:hypothetical protein